MFIFTPLFSFQKKYWLWLIPLLAVIYCLFEVGGKGDFYIFLSAASDLSEGENIFEKLYVDGYHYFYSVFFAILLKPFATLPFFTVKYFWILLNALLFVDLLRLLYSSPLVERLGEKKRDLFVLLCFFASLKFFMNNIHTSQITILILWCCIMGVYYISKNHPVKGSFILALGINIKLLPIVFIPYLLYRGYFKAVGLSIGFYILLMFVPSLFIGHDYNMFLLDSWARLINPLNEQHVLDVSERSFHGLSTLLSTLFVKEVPDQYALDITRNIADVSLETLSKIILMTRLVLIAFTLYFLALPPFKKAKNSFSQCLEVSYILLLVPLIFPHQQHYAFLFAMPAYVLLLYGLMMEPSVFKRKSVMIVLLVMIYLVFNLSLLLGAFNHYYDHFKVITYAALLLIPLLVYAKRSSEKISLPR